jgi:rfaE bifunctional protein nucleotidyltransferase chain/domain
MTKDKIKQEKEIVTLADRLRKQGKRIVTTNGSFDIFHFGHVKLLKECKKQGDVLIVGINSDHSVKQYKSPDRPINPENARAGVIAALESVDYVFIFDDTTPNRWLELIKPQIHCNSSEYGENCVERPVLDKIGTRLHLVKRKQDGLSTTEIINKIKSVY